MPGRQPLFSNKPYNHGTFSEKLPRRQSKQRVRWCTDGVVEPMTTQISPALTHDSLNKAHTIARGMAIIDAWWHTSSPT